MPTWRNRVRSAERGLAHMMGKQNFISGMRYNGPSLRNRVRSKIRVAHMFSRPPTSRKALRNRARAAETHLAHMFGKQNFVSGRPLIMVHH